MLESYHKHIKRALDKDSTMCVLTRKTASNRCPIAPNYRHPERIPVPGQRFCLISMMSLRLKALSRNLVRMYEFLGASVSVQQTCHLDC